MFAGLSPWDVATLLSKIVAYLAVFACIGSFLTGLLGLQMVKQPTASNAANTFSLPDFERHLSIYQGGAAVLGIVAVAAYFLFQIGAVNQQGIAGMFDSTMGTLIAETSVGEGTRMKFAGFGIALVAGIANWFSSHPAMSMQSARRARLVALVLSLLAAVLLSWSFAVLGHVANLSTPAKAAIAIHIVAVSLWIGSLHPLLKLCDTMPADLLAQLLRKFGQLAWAILIIMLGAGGFLLTQLLESPSDVFGTPYGLLVAGKIGTVGVLLGVAALNKFRLVPALEKGGSVRPLQLAISVEIGLMLVVLLLTGIFTTVLGPAN